MRILLIAMSDSIHTARWVSQIADQGWELHLFPCVDVGAGHPELANLTLHHSFYSRGDNPGEVTTRGIALGRPSVTARNVAERFFPRYRAMQLAHLVKALRPDVIHVLELQHAGYLFLESLRYLRDERLPPCLVSVWGSDLFLYGRLDEHGERIRETLGQFDFLFSDCRRDHRLAESHGFRGTLLGPLPGGGGFDLEECRALRAPGAVSARRIIMVKGYQGWSGRALFALRALARCADALQGYRVLVYSARTEEVRIAVELARKDSGMAVEIVPHGTPHREMLSLYGEARLAIGVGISDGTPNSMLEAMVMGAFPVQSATSGAEEWLRDGVSGLLVPPEDPDVIELALRRALAEDALVDGAAKENWRVALERLDHREIKRKVVEIYHSVAGSAGR